MSNSSRKETKETKETLVTHFDYEVLNPQQRILVEQWTVEIREQLRRTAQDIWEIGQRLAEVRLQLRHGQFDAWLKAEFGWSRRTAYNFINVYETFGNRANLAQIDIATSALYLLAAPSTPDKVRDKYIEEAKTGKRITHKELVQDIKHQQEKTDAKAVPNAGKKPELLAILPKAPEPIETQNPKEQDSTVIEVTAIEVKKKKQQKDVIANYSNWVNQSHWWRLGEHLLFNGDTASSEFFNKIPSVALAVAVTLDDWDHEWLIEQAATVIILQPSGLQANTLENLILMFSQPGDLVVFPWLPQENMVATAHNLKRRVIAGDPTWENCQRAILASGLTAEQL
jgi:DNA modification methylase